MGMYFQYVWYVFFDSNQFGILECFSVFGFIVGYVKKLVRYKLRLCNWFVNVNYGSEEWCLIEM